ncbi:hypothetical protein B0H34DRAFT_438263 [Crassisporium funariophilum]|nr:hypothetical protein B0H34DRAFT_438263 [Crassisporium funariophilum]
MTNTEFWLSYHLASRVHLPPTTQLVELEFHNQKLQDLEDVLDHVFRQGYVEAKYRPVTWFERKDGHKIKGSQLIDVLLKEGVGRSPETALRLVVEDLANTFWFTYVYLHGSKTVVTQRVKLNELPAKCDRLAHITNHLFQQGFLAAKLRPVVHWQKACGVRVEEHACVRDILSAGEGTCEEKPLRLIIDAPPACEAGCHCHHHRVL